MRYALNMCEQIPSDDDTTITYRGRCIVTGKEHEVTVPTKGLLLYISGGLIQDVFPELSADDREFLISGISPHWNWDKEFGDADVSLL